MAADQEIYDALVEAVGDLEDLSLQACDLGNIPANEVESEGNQISDDLDSVRRLLDNLIEEMEEHNAIVPA